MFFPTRLNCENMWANSRGPHPNSKIGRKICRCVITSSAKRRISKFHVVVVQWRLKNVPESVMHEQSCCSARYISFLLTSGTLRSARTAREAKTSLKNRIRVLPIFIAIIPTHSLKQTLLDLNSWNHIQDKNERRFRPGLFKTPRKRETRHFGVVVVAMLRWKSSLQNVPCKAQMSPYGNRSFQYKPKQ